MVSSDGHVFHNINKAKHVRKLEKQLKQAQRSLSRKYESLKNEKRKEELLQRQISENKC